MSSKSFLSQSIHTIITKGINLVLVFGAGIITARWLGPEGKGVVALYQALAFMIFPIAELGIRQSTAYFVGKDHSRSAEVYSNMQGIYFVVAALALIILLITYYSTGLLLKYGWGMSMVFGVIVPLMLFESYHNGVFISKKQIERMNYLVLLDKFATVVFLVGYVLFGNLQVFGAGLAYLSSRCVCFVLLNYWLKKEIQFLPKFNWTVWQDLLKQGILFSVALFVIQLNYRFSFLLLQHFKGSASVGIYSVGVNLAEVLKEIPLALGLVLFSRSANWKHEDIIESVKKTTMLSRMVFFVMILIGIVWSAISYFLIPKLYGMNFSGSVGVTWYLIPGVVFLGVFLVLHVFLAGQGKPYYSIFAVIPALIVNYILCIILIPRFDYCGAALSATISYFLGTMIFAVIFIKLYKVKLLNLFVVSHEDLKYLKLKMIPGR